MYLRVFSIALLLAHFAMDALYHPFQQHTYLFNVNLRLTTLRVHNILPSEHRCHNQVTHYIILQRKDKSNLLQTLLRSGNRGAILHNSRAVCVWRTFHTHKLQQQLEACHTTTKMMYLQLGTYRLSTERRLHAAERRLQQDPDLNSSDQDFASTLRVIQSICSQQRQITTSQFVRTRQRTTLHSI
jgi:hypothetical protein